MHASRLLTILWVSFLFSANANSLKAQTITHVPLYTFHGESAGDRFGDSVSGAGDVNGDGMADVIVGADGDDNNGPFSGIARVLSGNDGSVLYNFEGDSQFDHFGDSVSGAGDVNGDGTPDMIVGAFGDSNTSTDRGSGSASVLSGTDGSVLYIFNGDSAELGFGDSVSSAGDVNGDGRDDLIVGAPSDDTNGTDSGSARVLSGTDGSVLYTFYGDSAGDQFGISVSGAGDVNGDGKHDLVVGARFDDNNGDNSGSVRVFSGSDGSVLYNFDGDSADDQFGISVSGAGDVNGDGRDDLIVGAPSIIGIGSARVFSGSDGSVLFTFDGDSAVDQFGISVSGAGDVNGDGKADLIVGARGDSLARIFSGSNGSVLYTFNGDGVSDWFGWSVSGAGDVNGDGIDDFIVGSIFGGANDGGYARVFVSQIVLLGDCNRDGVIDFSDISPFITVLASDGYLAEADTDEDGAVTFDDISPFIVLLSL